MGQTGPPQLDGVGGMIIVLFLVINNVNTTKSNNPKIILTMIEIIKDSSILYIFS
jgi:hypothetical protein